MSMTTDVMTTWMEARLARRPCVLVTIAATSGSVPREAGTKMLVYPDASTIGTIGGGKMEALVIEASLQVLTQRQPVLKTYPLRDGQDDSFGAVCGGEATILIEPPPRYDRLVIFGAGHCARAIARLASDCGFSITVFDDRTDLIRPTDFPRATRLVSNVSIDAFVAERTWTADDTVVLVNRNHLLDRDALRLLLPHATSVGYLGMIGSRRKVLRVFDELKSSGSPVLPSHRVFAPIGLDLGADSPDEIAISVLAEILMVRHQASGNHLTLNSA